MRLKVPFVKTPRKYIEKKIGICGPVALKSILSYYKISASIKDISKISGMPEKGGVSAFGLAYVCLKNNLKVEYVSKTKFPDSKKVSKRLKSFLEEYNILVNDKNFFNLCEESDNFRFISKNPTIKIIEDFVKREIPVLAIFNVIYAFGKDSVNAPWGGHYTVIAGYDKNNFYIHNNSWPKNEAYHKIDKNLFMKSMVVDGQKGIILGISEN